MVQRGMREHSALPPGEAFAAVGNEIRIRVLQVIGEADGPLAFTELHERVGTPDSGQFNYHLGKLKDHFVTTIDDGYRLTRAGERVVESILSGAVTEAPVLERTEVDQVCHFCGAPTEIEYREERLERYCTECPGMWGSSEPGYLGRLALPPVGVLERSPDEAVRAASTWQTLTIFALGNDICPRCSAPMDNEVSVCEPHDACGGVCERCDSRYAATLQIQCPNCIFETRGTLASCFSSHTDLLAFMTAHGINPVATDDIAAVHRAYSDYEEEILSVDPFRGRFTFSIDGDELMVTVDDELDVVDVSSTDPPAASVP